jgi:hypothetical protein
MFEYRSSAFGPSVAAIQKHLGAVEKELEKIGHIAGDRTSAAAATASDQAGDAISTILNKMVERFPAGPSGRRRSSRALEQSGPQSRRQIRQRCLAAGRQRGRRTAARNRCHRAWHRDFNWRRGFDPHGQQSASSLRCSQGRRSYQRGAGPGEGSEPGSYCVSMGRFGPHRSVSRRNKPSVTRSSPTDNVTRVLGSAYKTSHTEFSMTPCLLKGRRQPSSPERPAHESPPVRGFSH